MNLSVYKKQVLLVTCLMFLLSITNVFANPYVKNATEYKSEVPFFIEKLSLNKTEVSLSSAAIYNKSYYKLGASKAIKKKETSFFEGMLNAVKGFVFSSKVTAAAFVVGGTGPGDDFDGDGVLNKDDIDDDNDGILDADEMGTYPPGDGTQNCKGIPADGGAMILNNSFTSPTVLKTDPSNSNGGYATTTEYWTIASGSVDTKNSDVWGLSPYDINTGSSQSLDLNGSNPGFIEQSVDVVPNTPYTLSFYYSGRALNITGTLEAEVVDASNNSLVSLSIPSSDFSFQWDGTKNEYVELASFTPTTSSVKIKLSAPGSTGSQGPLIDGIELKGATPDSVANLCPPLELDTDNDGIPNHLDLDSDGDGCSDAYEAGATTDTTADYQFPDVDANNDGLVDAVDAGSDGAVDYTPTYAQTIDGASSCPVVVTCTDPNKYSATCDFDGDGVLNKDDLDDDNDGILDTVEGFCYQTPEFVMKATATASGAGSAGFPVLNMNIPSERYGFLVVLVTVERDHTGAGGVGGNWAYPAGTVAPLKFAGTTLNSLGSLYTYVSDLPRDISIAKHSMATTVYYIAIDNVALVNESFDFSGFSPPKNAGDEFSITAVYYKGVVGIEYKKHSIEMLSTTNSWNISGESTNINNVLMSYSESSNDTGITGTPNWDFIASTKQANSNGTLTDLRGSNENSGLSTYLESITGVLGSQTASYTVSPDNIHQGGIMFELKAEVCNVPDTDKDGTPDYLDLDSDNDGCSDALEGAQTTLTLADVDGKGILTGAVDANGVPTIVSGGQADVSGADPAITGGQCDDDGDGVINKDDKCNGFDDKADNDTDLVPDGCDLDDDNDGILDSVECTLSFVNFSSNTRFGVGLGEVAIDGSIDVSTRFSLPAGSVIINYENLSTRTTGGQPAVSASQPTTFTITGTVPVYVAIRHGGDLSGVNSYDGIESLDNVTYNFTSTLETGYTDSVLANNYQVISDASSDGNNADKFRWQSSSFVSKFKVVTSRRTLNNNYRLELAICKDTDSDGTPDYLDRDSDNDGCSDALEGAQTTLTLASVDGKGILTGAVDANGVPTIVNGGQADVSSTDASVTGDECDDDGDGVVNKDDKCNGFDDKADNDGDLVPDGCDLDDDNDGILDSVEKTCSENGSIIWDSTTKGLLSNTFTASSSTATIIGTVATLATSSALQGPIYANGSGNANIDITSRGGSGAIIGNETVISFPSEVTFSEFNVRSIAAANGSPTIAPNYDETQIIEFYNGTTRVYFDGTLFTEGTGTIYHHPYYDGIDATYASGGPYYNKLTGVAYPGNTTTNVASPAYGGVSALEAGYKFIINEPITKIIIKQSPLAKQDNIGIRILDICLGYQDTDSDGTPDYLDRDSDNDGCPDALEGAQTTLTLASVDGKGILTGAVDANGVPTLVSGGQADVSSTDPVITGGECDDDGDGVLNKDDKCNGFDDAIDSDTDGVPDGCDLDNDNDGILDSVECRATWAVWDTSTSGTGNITGVVDGIAVSITNTDSPILRNPNVGVVGVFLGDQGHNNEGADFAGASIINAADNLGETYTITFSSATTRPLYIHFTAVDGPTVTLTGATIVSLINGTGIGTSVFTMVQHSDPSVVNEGGFSALIPVGTSVVSYLKSAGGDNYMFGITEPCFDTDSDGTSDYLDRDSDNDGCSDALEGAQTTLTLASVDGKGILTGAVDANGVPTLVSGGQADVSSTDPAITGGECDDDGDGVLNKDDKCNGFDDAIDSDTDGVPDGCDLDNDNDGILDSVECGALLPGAVTGIDTNTLTGTFTSSVLSTDFTLTSPSQIELPLGNKIPVKFKSYAGVTEGILAYWDEGNVIPNTFDIKFTLQAPVNGVLNALRIASNAPGSAYGAQNAKKQITLTWPGGTRAVLSDPLNEIVNLTDGAVITSGTILELDSGTNQILNSRWYLDIDLAGVSYPFSLDYHTVSSVLTRYEGFSFLPKGCSDLDGDTLTNNLDLDSDADGCNDVLESGGIDADNDGILDGTGFDADGKVTGGVNGYDGATGNEYKATKLTADFTGLTDQTVAEGTATSFTLTSATAETTISYDASNNPVYGTTGNANIGIQYQWYLGDPATGTALTNTGVYSTVTTATLNISDVKGLGGSVYYLKVTHADNVCIESVGSATLSVFDPCKIGAILGTVTANDPDADGINNVCDSDDDNDGISDTDENINNKNPDADADADGIPLYLDDDDTNAAIGDVNNSIEADFDTDNDGIPNHLDLDADNDGIYDVVEAGGTDTNNDGKADHSGADYSDTAGIPDSAFFGLGVIPKNTNTITGNPADFLNIDSDGDGCSDANEAYNNANTDTNSDGTYGGVITSAEVNANGLVTGAAYGAPNANYTIVSYINSICYIDICTEAAGTDTDNDRVNDICDVDIDNDGILNENENCNSPVWGTAPLTWIAKDDSGTITLAGGIDMSIDITTTATGDLDAFGGTALNLSATGTGTFGTLDDLAVLFDPAANQGASPVKIQIDFTKEMYNLNFKITDIDAGGFGFRMDKITITSDVGNPILTKVSETSSSFTVANNQATAIRYATSDKDNKGTILVQVPDGAKSITIIYEEVGTVSDPGVRGIGILGDLKYCLDTDNDGTPDSNDLDSDNDGCNDVLESGGIDADNDGILDGTGFDADGKVTGGINGYNGATGNEYKATKLTADFTALTDQTVAEGTATSFTLTSAIAETTISYDASNNPVYGTTGNANIGIQYQWYLGDPATGTALTNTGVYTTVTTAILNISDVTGLGGNKYYLKVTHADNVCIESVGSAVLGVNPIAQDDTLGSLPTNTDAVVNPLIANGGAADSDPDGSLDATTVSLVGTCDSGSTDANGDCLQITVPGEGVWSVD
ncbi:DUF642 domain-containing protein, partial [Tenacibaculum finnmarkense]|uniref:beta strand repeat-containing protein n=1 Tax=Tenacibaculum finnmarkense TaxID=2781243 RepID=UPI001EFC1CBF